MKRIPTFISELFRRKVVRVLAAYIAIFWLLAQGLDLMTDAFDLPAWVLRSFIIVGVALLPLVAWVSWKYDITPPQIVQDPQDLANANPGLKWARPRHDNVDAGFVLLKWQTADDTVQEKRFFKPISIGRGLDNEVDFADERVSRYHAVIWAEEGAWHVRDLESANGTFINQTRVNGTAALPPSCELRFHANGPTLGVHIAKPAETVVA